MRIAIVNFDGPNELDSFIALDLPRTAMRF